MCPWVCGLMVQVVQQQAHVVRTGAIGNEYPAYPLHTALLEGLLVLCTPLPCAKPQHLGRLPASQQIRHRQPYASPYLHS